MKRFPILFVAFLLASLASCDGTRPEAVNTPGLQARKGVAEVEPIAGKRIVAGQTIYVPAYSAVYTSDRADRFNLAITLSIRNTDRQRPIIVTIVRYYDHDGETVREYVKKPLRVGPMAAAEFFVTESDTAGGVSASFLVEWVAEQAVDVPVVEAVMAGTASTQGVSFNCPGRVLADRAHPVPALP